MDDPSIPTPRPSPEALPSPFRASEPEDGASAESGVARDTPAGDAKPKKKPTKKPKGKGKKDGLGTTRGIETMFRTSYQTHNDLSGLADNKANIMISINGIIISILVASIAPNIRQSVWLMIPLAVLVLGCLTSLVFAVLTARPRIPHAVVTVDDVRNGKANVLFFGNFVRMEPDAYVEAMRILMEDTDRVYVSMMRDIYSLGLVLDRKFRLLRYSYTAFLIGLVAGVLLVFVAYGLTGATLI